MATAMRVLLDTHVLLWWLLDENAVSRVARAAIADDANETLVSAASAWEIAIKTRLGRLDGEALLSAWADIIAGMRTTELPIESPDAILAGRLPWEHKDPFDRVIVAQALRRNLTIATRDSKILDAALTATLQA